MSTHKHFDKLCCVVMVLVLLFTILLMNVEASDVLNTTRVMGYEDKLFDTSTVHTLDIVMDEWDDFIAHCESEEYYNCTVIIDNETFQNVAIRGKGNTSLSQVSSYGNDRYSFKIEFDHYDDAYTYHGLDKLCLNNIIQDNTYMKDYLTYRMMSEMGVAAPLCSYVYITVNGEDWGLYLAVEGVEDSFLTRNFGNNYGDLYKPDSMRMGGGRGNGEKFDMEQMQEMQTQNVQMQDAPMPDETFEMPEIPNAGNPEERVPGGRGSEKAVPSERMPGEEIPDGKMHGGEDDVLLKYIDDNPDSYANIFDNAKTSITSGDQLRLIQSLKQLSTGESLPDTVDIETVIRYFVVHNFVLNFDSYTGDMIHNYYLYENDGQMQMIPWDYNLAFGGFQSMGDATSLVNYPIDSPVSGGNTGDRPMIAWIFASEEYTELYHTYFAQLLAKYFESGYFETMIDGVSEMIAPYVEKDPTKFCTYEEFEKGIATLREFCILRAESIRGQLDGAIGSTTDTQAADTLIDAGELQISDMGSMHGGNMMHGGGMNGSNMQRPEFSGEGMFPGEGAFPEQPEGTIPERPEGEFQERPNNVPPDQPNGTFPDQQNRRTR